MQPTARIKTEYWASFNKTLCHACLSFDRKLYVLGEFSEIYQKICFHSAWDMSSEIFLCWECRSILKRVKCFKNQVAKAQIILKSYNHDKIPIKSLSNLQAVKPVTLDYNGTKFIDEKEQKCDITFEVKKIESPQPIVKEEYETDYNDDFDSFNYEPMEVVKDENLPVSLKELTGITVKKIKQDITDKPSNTTASRRLRYKMTPQNLENVVKKVAIDGKDLDAWLERERSSTYFKNLKNKCEKCLLTIGREFSKTHHKKYHVKSKSMGYGCNICHKWFPTELALTSHTEQHYFFYSCTICGYECYTKPHMRSHLREHSSIVKCLECEATYTNTRKFFAHYRAAHRIFICDYCNKKTKNKKALVKHIYNHHRTHKCDECALTFANYRTHKEHKNLKHHIERSEASYCVQCNMQFDNIIQFRRHIKYSVAHLKERNEAPKKVQVPCPECPNVYARRCNMMNHYRKVHLKQAKYYCTICQKSILNRTRYKEHMMYVHEGREKQRNKICYVCGRGFFNNRILENHVRTHTGERPYECTHCDARFAQKVALDSHVKFIHMKNKRKPNDEVKKMMQTVVAQ